MRQVARRLRDGRLELAEVPTPQHGPGEVLVRVEHSVISSGTERATLEVARKGLLAKAMARPDQSRQVLERARREGLRSTLALVRRRLDELGPLGYSASGTALRVGAEVKGVKAGDRVAIAGGGFANHAELDVVPGLLCAPVPERVSSEDAAFATLGAIALHGFRRTELGIGSTVAMIGLGLIGQLGVRIARAAGCRVVGVDLEPRLVELARRGGANAVERSAVAGLPLGGSADAVVIYASAAGSDDPVELAAELAGDRAPIVVVGNVGMRVPRAPFYEKELDLRLSRSYGPGRYDPAYELHGNDYPIGYVRWTEQRNMAAFLQLVADGDVRPGELVSHRYPFSQAEIAFAALDREPRPVGVLLDYRAPTAATPTTETTPGSERGGGDEGPPRRRKAAGPGFGLVGAGSYAMGTLVPGLVKQGFRPTAVVTAGGLSAESARRGGFARALPSLEDMLSCDGIDLVVIATQHDSHAELVCEALQAGIATYVEKPLALDEQQLAAGQEANRAAGVPLFVGFNRRFAPLAVALRKLPGPRLMSYRVNAGPLPVEHWTNDPKRGGGRLIGEGCHFVDFLCDQAGADPVSVSAVGFPSSSMLPLRATDNFSLQIEFADRSVGTISYAADAPAGPGKERFETSSHGMTAVIDDFRRGAIWTSGGRRRIGKRLQDKGFDAQFRNVFEVVCGRAPPPDVESYLASSLATVVAARALETGKSEAIIEPGSTAPVTAV
jgi:predicted dehydrogenase/threonine dehydrogenase-like Zn-dependent dehydrogenase